MQYTVDPQFEAFIRDQVASGRFTNADDVINEGLRLVEQRERKIAQLRQEVQEALADPRRYTFDEVMAHIEDSCREKTV